MRSRWLRPIVAAPGSWNPDLHPRARDGKFIEVLGFIDALINGKWTRAQVTSIVPNAATPGVPDIHVDVIDGSGKKTGTATIKAAQVNTAQKAKALLSVPFTPRNWATTWKSAAELDEHIAGLAPAERLKEFEYNASVPRSPSLPSRLKKLNDADLKSTFDAIDSSTNTDIAREVKIEMARRGFTDELSKAPVLDEMPEVAPEPTESVIETPVGHVWDSGSTFILQTAGLDPKSDEAKLWLKRVKGAGLTLDPGEKDNKGDVKVVREQFMRGRMKDLGVSDEDATEALKWLHEDISKWTWTGGVTSLEDEFYPIADKLFRGEPMVTPKELAMQAQYEYTQAVLQMKNPSGITRLVRVISGYQGYLVELAKDNNIDISFGTRPLSSWSVEKGLPSLRAWLGGRQQVWQEVPNDKVLISFWGDERFRTKDLKAKGEYVIWAGGPIINPEVVIDESREHNDPNYFGREILNIIAAMRDAGREDELTGEWLNKMVGLFIGHNPDWFKFVPESLFEKLGKEAPYGTGWSEAKEWKIKHIQSLFPQLDKWIKYGFDYWQLQEWSDNRRRTRYHVESLYGDIMYDVDDETEVYLDRLGTEARAAYLKGAIDRGLYLDTSNNLFKYIPAGPNKEAIQKAYPDWSELTKATPEQLAKMQETLQSLLKNREDVLAELRPLGVVEKSAKPDMQLAPDLLKRIDDASTLLREFVPWIADELDKMGMFDPNEIVKKLNGE